MPRISTLDDQLPTGSTLQVYNGLDCCVTLEVLREVKSLVNVDPGTYNFTRQLQAPALEMMLRGFRIDNTARQQAIKDLETEITRLQFILDSYSTAIWNKPLNANSPAQLKKFFYGIMALPEQHSVLKGVRKVSTNREALEKLSAYFYASPIVEVILAIRDRVKQKSVFETEIDADGRMRTSYNISGTETGRWSSSSNAYGTGTNLQNIAPKLRYPFIADDGKKICGIDLEQAESREVGLKCGLLFEDWTYLDAAESGDLHTLTCKLIWKNLPWTGDPKADRKIADQIFYREFSYRDMSKRGGHGCLSIDHEVLTRNGWVNITEKPEEILTFSDNKSYFDKVSNWTDFNYTGTICEFEGNSISLKCTADHRIPYKKDQRYALCEKKAIEGPATFMPLGYNFVGGTEKVPARLIAAFMSDGHQKSTNRMEFHFKKERKIKRLHMLCKMYGFDITDKGDIFSVIGSLPKTPGPFMLNWTKQCIEEFIDEYKFWDGHQSTTAVALFSTKRKDLEWIQTLGRIVGIGGAIQNKPNTSGYGSLVYRLQQNNRKFASGVSMSFKKSHYDSIRVLCPTVSSSFFYVRRNGKIFVTGNSNYLGTPVTMAKHLKVPTKLMREFQDAYFSAFPAIPRWHRWVAQQLQTTQKLTTSFGRTRTFFGRPNDDSTLREAIAFEPQSSTGDRLNLGLLAIWKHLPQVQLIAQVHDALYFQYNPADEAWIIPKALDLIQIKQTFGSRTFIIPGEAKVGWNWGNFNDDPSKGKLNLDGLKKYKGSDSRTRTTFLDRTF